MIKKIVRHQFVQWIIIYSAAFAIMLPAVFFPFFRDHITFIWKEDGLNQHALSVLYLGEWIRAIFHNFVHGHFSIPFYSLRLAQGIDIPGYFSTWYYDLIYWIFAPFAYYDNIENIYMCIIFSGLYLTGFSMLCYSRYHQQRMIPAVIGALMYAYCGYALVFGTRHPHFLHALYFLPFMLIGVERIVEKGSFKWFMLAASLSLIQSYYFTYMNSFLCFFYFWILVYVNKVEWKKIVKDIIKVIISCIVAVCVSAVVLFPAAYTLIHSTRAAGSPSMEELIWYNAEQPSEVFCSFITPGYTPGAQFYVFCGVISVMMLMVLFAQKKKYLTHKIVFCSLCAASILPAFGYAAGVFSKLNNRWSYAVSFFLAYNVVSMLPELFTLKKRQLIYCFFPIILYLYCYKYIQVQGQIVRIIALIAIANAALMTVMICLKVNESVASAVLLLFVMMNLSVNGYITFDPGYQHRMNQFVERGKAAQFLSESYNSREIQNVIKEDGLFRSDIGLVPNTVYANGPLLSGRMSTSMHHSALNRNLMEFFLETENCGIRLSCILFDLDGRYISESLASEKYYIVRQGEDGYVPYGYRFYSSVQSQGEEYDIYENPDVLPFGYTYSKSMTVEKASKYNPVEKQELMSEAAITEDDQTLLSGTEDEIVMTSEMEEPGMEFHDALPEEDGLLVKKKNGGITLSFKGKKECETYVRLVGVSVDKISPKERIAVIARTKTIEKRITVFGEQYDYNPGYHSMMVNLGYSDDAQKTCDLLFPKKGFYEIRKIEVYYLPVNAARENLSALSEETLEDVKVTSNRIDGRIHVSKEKILCLNIPYSYGWTILVDGKKVDTFRVNYAYTGCRLAGGDHKIIMKYVPPGMKIGLLLSVFGIVCLIITFAADKGRQYDARQISV